MMMTDAQVEAAARELCRLRGVDPDAVAYHETHPQIVTSPDGDYMRAVYMRAVKAPVLVWELAAREVRAAEQLAEALRAGREAAP